MLSSIQGCNPIVSTRSQGGPHRPITPLAWLLAALALVPLAGLIFGLMAFEWGMRTRDGGGRPLAVFAAVMLAIGVAITIGGYVYRDDIMGGDGDPGDIRPEIPLAPPASSE